MTIFTTILILFSSISFLYYAASLLVNADMKVEFERYGLENLRTLTGYLQLLGAIGLLVGLKFSLILSAASICLSLLMLLGFSVRLKIHDGFIKSSPSFLFMCLNLYIFYASLKVH